MALTKQAPEPRTVLVAEQDEAVRGQLVDELTRDGYHVVGLEDGLGLRDYLDAAYARDEPVEKPSVIISDAALSGLGGLEVFARLHAHQEWPAFILLADHDDEDVYDAAELAGADFVFDKPLDLDELRSAVSWLSSRG